jgi:hypothetical protein
MRNKPKKRPDISSEANICPVPGSTITLWNSIPGIPRIIVFVK